MAVAVTSELQGTIVGVFVERGTAVDRGHVLALIESMKMHHEVVAPQAGTVDEVLAAVGSAVVVGERLIILDESVRADGEVPGDAPGAAVGPSDGAAGEHVAVAERADLAAVVERHERGLDAHRPAAVERRRQRGRRTTRDRRATPAAFTRRSDREHARRWPRRWCRHGERGTVRGRTVRRTGAHRGGGDVVRLHGARRHPGHTEPPQEGPAVRTRRTVAAADRVPHRGRRWSTRRHRRHRRQRPRLPRVPLVRRTVGHRPARRGQRRLLLRRQCGDPRLLRRGDRHRGLEHRDGGPAMIEGGGLGLYEPTEIGPIEVQRANGVVDIVVADEAAAIAAAKQYLSYFQGRTLAWEAAPDEEIRNIVPVDRLRAYDMHRAIDALFDVGSVLELRREFGVGMITALARLEGRPVGVVANNPTHLAGAIDSDGADKAARFLQLCDAFCLPIVTLVDTPGMMVGPDVEATALVRHCSRLFVTGANVSVPMVSIVTRKAYGLGAQAMMGGSTKAPLACLAWPTGEFGGMGLEGAVRLGYRKELEAAVDDVTRDALFREMVDRMYEHGKALSVATHFEIDDVIDPADTRRWIARLLDSAPQAHWRDSSPRRPNIDTW